MDISAYIRVCGRLGVLNDAVLVPEEVSEVVGRLFSADLAKSSPRR
jgi:hypothetical protein